MKYALIDSPLGNLLITASDTGIQHILFEDMPAAVAILARANDPVQANPVTEDREDPTIRIAQQQLQEYFSGQRDVFDLPLAGIGTEFQQKVWRQLCTIPYAETWNYGQLARALGQPTAARAVGMANGKNPLSIVVPCHRVIGANRQLTGYAGGLERKSWLLAHEEKHRR